MNMNEILEGMNNTVRLLKAKMLLAETKQEKPVERTVVFKGQSLGFTSQQIEELSVPLDQALEDAALLMRTILKPAAVRALTSGSPGKLIWDNTQWETLTPDIRDYWLEVARTVFQTPGLNWRYPTHASVETAAKAVHKLSHKEKGPSWQDLGDEQVFYEDLVWAVLDIGNPTTAVYRDVDSVHIDDESIVLKSGFGNVELRDLARIKMLTALHEKSIQFSKAARVAFETYQKMRGIPAQWEENAHLHMAWTAAVAASAACLITPDQTNTQN